MGLVRGGAALGVLAVWVRLIGGAGAQPAPAPAPADKARLLADAEGQQEMAERSLAIGEYARGAPFAEAALREREAALGPDDPLVADSALVLGVMRAKNGDHAGAEVLLARALAIRERALPRTSLAVAAAQVAYAAFLREVGAYARAAPMLAAAVASEERAADAARSPGLARALEEQALLLAEQDDPRSEPLLRRAIGILELAAGPDALALAPPLQALGELLARRGDVVQAEPLYLRAMAILESTGDLGDPRRAAALLAFARVRLAGGAAAEAMALGGLAYTIDVTILGADHPFVARDLLQLAELARATGEPARAERYVWRALTIRERALGPDHPEVGRALVALATAYEVRGDVANAIKLFERALRIFRTRLGPTHPAVAQTLSSLARLRLVQHDVPAALAAATEAGEIREASLELLLGAGSERQKRLYLATLAEETEATIALHAQFAPGDVVATRLALLTVLRRKGRVLDTMVDTLAALRGRVSAADAALLDRLAATRSRLAQLVLQGPAPGVAADAHAREVAMLTDEAQRLEAEIGATSAAFRADRTRVTLAGIQAAIPAGRVLIELASYQPLAEGGAGPGARRYVAYVLAASGDPRWVDLGPQGPIDDLVREARLAFADSARSDAVALARQLDARVMAPIRPLLGTAESLLLSPDGALNLVPFGAFVDEAQRFLVERFAITYLTTGRDLVRLAGAAAPAPSTGVVVMADPAFGPTTAGPDAAGAAQRRSSDLAGVVFPPLPGTREEGLALTRLLRAPALFTGADATEAALKRAHAPIVLHVATHGFFLGDLAGGPAGARALVRVAADGAPAAPVGPAGPARVEHPLLRSGLAFAGVNQRASGDDDGVLTALEASGLDLWGTQLVVLSACETGVGEVHNGEGVYGLRRALVMAGAESQVISLWKVDDLATRDLMIDYYARLAGGAGRADALRAAQLAMLRSPARRHPFFWASFIPSGDWRPVRESAASGLRPVARGARGCGCHADGARGEAGTALALGAVLFGLGVRRRRPARRATAGLVVGLALGLVLGARGLAAADPPRTSPVTLPASGLEVELPGAPSPWTVSDGSSGGHAWDLFRRSGPELTIRIQSVVGPTSCLLTLNLRYLSAMQAARVVTGPGYLPPAFHRDTLELTTGAGVTALACADLPDGAVTAILFYTGTDWARDAAAATPVLRELAAAAAWGPGRRAAVERDVTLPSTGLRLRLPAGWKEEHAPTIDIIARRQVGKPLLRIGVHTDVVRPLVLDRGKMVPRKLPKGVADSCGFWSEGLRLAPVPDLQVVPRPAFVPPSWHAEAVVTVEPRRDRLVVCLDTADGRWLATLEYFGALTDPGLADATTILHRLEGRP